MDGTVTCVLLVDSIILISFSYLLFNITQEVAFVKEEVSNSSSLMVKRKRKHTDLVSTDEVDVDRKTADHVYDGNYNYHRAFKLANPQ